MTPDVVEGIIVGDQELDERFTSEPRCYGACEVSDNEKQALSLPPKFALYTKIDSVSVEAEIEKGLAKYRWEQMEKKEPVEEAGVVYDTATKKVYMRNLRATDFPFNKRVILPSALSEEKEVGLQHLKNNMMKSVNNYVQNDKNKQWQNLTENEKNGLRSLRKRSKDNSVVIYQTDKSGRFSIDTAENYLLACEPHVKGDETITQQDYERLESEMNAHSVIWTRILGAGHGTGHVNRIKNNMITHDCPLAPLYTLRKDHKTMDDEVKGPPVRPVCGAVSAYNQRLSHEVSKILNEVWKEEGSVCISTEDIMAGIKKANDELRNNVDNEVIVGSADVKALYPSLDVDFTVDKVCEVFYGSEVRVEGVNVEELGLYLSVSLKEDDLMEAGIAPYCPTRKSNRGRPPSITGSVLEEKKEKRFMSWKPASEQPDEVATRRMLTEALRVVLTFIMKNHVYKFDGTVRKQAKGGAIGLELTGVLAQIFMVWWDREFKARVERLGIPLYMYKRYVDDINVIVGAVEPGAKIA